MLFAVIRNAHKLRPFCARYLLALSTYITWFLKKILHLLASLTFFTNIHVCVFQGALEKKHLPMLWLDNPLHSAKHGGAAAGAVLLAGTASGVAEPGLRSRILPQRTSPVQDHATQLPVARNKALSVWAQYFQNRFVFVFFNPLLLRLICSFIPRWKEVKKYLFNKPYHLPLSHYVIYRRTAQPSLSMAVLPQVWVCFDLWRAVQVSWALLSEMGPTFTTLFAALATVWDFCAVIKGRVKSKREAGRPGPAGGRAPSHHSPIASSARQLAGPRHGASGHWRRRAPRSAQQPGGMLEMSCAERLILKEGRRVCPVRKASMKHAAASTLTCPPSHIPQACLSHQVAFPWCGPGRACGLLQILALLQLCCTEVEFLLF